MFEFIFPGMSIDSTSDKDPVVYRNPYKRNILTGEVKNINGLIKSRYKGTFFNDGKDIYILGGMDNIAENGDSEKELLSNIYFDRMPCKAPLLRYDTETDEVFCLYFTGHPEHTLSINGGYNSLRNGSGINKNGDKLVISIPNKRITIFEDGVVPNEFTKAYVHFSNERGYIADDNIGYITIEQNGKKVFFTQHENEVTSITEDFDLISVSEKHSWKTLENATHIYMLNAFHSQVAREVNPKPELLTDQYDLFIFNKSTKKWEGHYSPVSFSRASSMQIVGNYLYIFSKDIGKNQYGNLRYYYDRSAPFARFNLVTKGWSGPPKTTYYLPIYNTPIIIGNKVLLTLGIYPGLNYHPYNAPSPGINILCEFDFDTMKWTRTITEEKQPVLTMGACYNNDGLKSWKLAGFKLKLNWLKDDTVVEQILFDYGDARRIISIDINQVTREVEIPEISRSAYGIKYEDQYDDLPRDISFRAVTSEGMTLWSNKINLEYLWQEMENVKSNVPLLKNVRTEVADVHVSLANSYSHDFDIDVSGIEWYLTGIDNAASFSELTEYYVKDKVFKNVPTGSYTASAKFVSTYNFDNDRGPGYYVEVGLVHNKPEPVDVNAISEGTNTYSFMAEPYNHKDGALYSATRLIVYGSDDPGSFDYYKPNVPELVTPWADSQSQLPGGVVFNKDGEITCTRGCTFGQDKINTTCPVCNTQVINRKISLNRYFSMQHKDANGNISVLKYPVKINSQEQPYIDFEEGYGINPAAVFIDHANSSYFNINHSISFIRGEFETESLNYFLCNEILWFTTGRNSNLSIDEVEDIQENNTIWSGFSGNTQGYIMDEFCYGYRSVRKWPVETMIMDVPTQVIPIVQMSRIIVNAKVKPFNILKKGIKNELTFSVLKPTTQLYSNYQQYLSLPVNNQATIESLFASMQAAEVELKINVITVEHRTDIVTLLYSDIIEPTSMNVDKWNFKNIPLNYTFNNNNINKSRVYIYVTIKNTNGFILSTVFERKHLVD